MRCHPRAVPSRGLRERPSYGVNVGRDRTAPRARAQRKERSIRAPRSRLARSPRERVFGTYPSTTSPAVSPPRSSAAHPLRRQRAGVTTQTRQYATSLALHPAPRCDLLAIILVTRYTSFPPLSNPLAPPPLTTNSREIVSNCRDSSGRS
ncbi:hypothetical protein PUN28_005556 [Cardiocondyla obscurior]|uniref:Uncharacterized protein n=1 Tax=Cardiocondyla obscurior TaxID=286306 RepID=A0AAW2GIE4_9HYME